jgi:hypothetical protein
VGIELLKRGDPLGVVVKDRGITFGGKGGRGRVALCIGVPPGKGGKGLALLGFQAGRPVVEI